MTGRGAPDIDISGRSGEQAVPVMAADPEADMAPATAAAEAANTGSGYPPVPCSFTITQSQVCVTIGRQELLCQQTGAPHLSGRSVSSLESCFDSLQHARHCLCAMFQGKAL